MPNAARHACLHTCLHTRVRRASCGWDATAKCCKGLNHRIARWLLPGLEKRRMGDSMHMSTHMPIHCLCTCLYTCLCLCLATTHVHAHVHACGCVHTQACTHAHTDSELLMQFTLECALRRLTRLQFSACFFPRTPHAVCCVLYAV